VIDGVNYPWRRYGGDFGPTLWGGADGIRAHAAEVSADLAAIATAGFRVVRWFVFTDARGGLVLDADGWPAGIHGEAIDDLDSLFAMALDRGVQIVPVLFDHRLAFDASEAAGVVVGGHAAWLAEPEGQRRLLEAVIGPLAARYGARGSHAALGRAVFAWDLFNEPDWIVAELHPSPSVSVPIPFDVFASWVRVATATLHAHDAGPVTIGNARLRFARWWDDPAFAFAFLQVHPYYDPEHDHDLLDVTPGRLGVARPLVLGECAGRGEIEDPRRGREAMTLAAMTAAARQRGFAGVWPWSWRGADRHGSLREADQDALRAAFGD
jgi:hypothetical protein